MSIPTNPADIPHWLLTTTSDRYVNMRMPSLLYVAIQAEGRKRGERVSVTMKRLIAEGLIAAAKKSRDSS